MKKKSKRTLTPKLRFPEFRDRPYQNVRLGDVAEEATERNRKTLDADVVMGVFKGEGMLPMEKRLVANNISRYKVVEKDWFAYNPMRLNIGSIARWSGDESVLVSPDYIVFRCSNDSNQKIDPNYLDHFRYSDQWDRFVTLSGDGSVRVRIYFRDLATLRLILPSLSEQQKIAECLSSLDGLIAAEGRTLEALKAHKKGLMQQLFPQPGKTQPRLRFPDFRDKGEWKTMILGDVVSISKGKGIAKSDVVAGGITPCIRYAELYTIYGEIITHVHSRTNVPVNTLVLSQVGDVIIPASGETKEDIATCGCVMNAGVALGSDLNVLRSDIDGRFLSYYLNGVQRRELAKVAQGDTVAHLYPSQISRLSICVTEELSEQHRIAACLTALDTQITAQAAKIESLMQHKRGLMQQLFPAPEDDVS